MAVLWLCCGCAVAVLWLCCDCAVWLCCGRSLRFRQVLGFLKSAGADLSAALAGWTPLMLATSEGQVATVKFLLRRGVPWQGKNGRVSAAPSLLSPFVVNPCQVGRPCDVNVGGRAVLLKWGLQALPGPFLCGGGLESDSEHVG